MRSSVTRNDSNPYSISKSSDGERNAILIATDVLTAPPGTLLLIDEPERHLHRSVISPLLSLLFKERSDCAFVVSTHEPSLPMDNPESQVLLVRACTYKDDAVEFYDVDWLDNVSEIDDNLKSAILGERRKILFVEGTESSLDKPLYSILFPNVSVVAKGNCREVEHAVVSIKGTTKLHWIEPFGLVDNDSSQPDRLNELQEKGVTPLDVYSVESIYYHPKVQELVVCEHAKHIGNDLIEILNEANSSALEKIRENAKHLSDKVAEKFVRAKIFSYLPRKGDVANGKLISIKIECEKQVNEEYDKINALIAASNFVEILKRYPIRESSACDAIVKTLGYQSRNQYEKAVREFLMNNSNKKELVRQLLGSLPSTLTA